MRLPTDNQARKDLPIATGFMDYFPDAMAAVAELSRIANEKHNPGMPMHWSKDKSTDHADCLIRHFMQRGTWDTVEGVAILHSTEMAWRAMAILQLEIEASRDGPRHVVVHKLNTGFTDKGGDPSYPGAQAVDVRPVEYTDE